MQHNGERTERAGAWWGLALVGQSLFLFAVVAISAPGRIDIVDGQTRYEVARSLVEHGDSIVRDPDVWFNVFKGRDGQRYADYRIPQTALGVVAIGLADATGPVSETRRHFFFSLISPAVCAALGLTYTFWFRALGHGPAASLFWATAGVFLTPSWYYGTSAFDDILGTSAVVLAVAVAWRSRRRWPLLGAAVAGLVMGWAVNCKPPLGFFVLPVLAAGYRPGRPLSRQAARVGLVFSGIALGVVAYKAYDLYKFPPGTTNTYLEYVEQNGPMWTMNPIPGLASLALSPSAGVFWYCPTLALSCFGWFIWRRKHRGYCRAVLAASGLFTLFFCFLTFFKGEPCWGPRYLTPVFALWWVFVPAAVEYGRRRLTVPVLAMGLLVQLLGLTIDPQRLFYRSVLPFNYYVDTPWLTFHPGASHLSQRGWEIIEVLTPREEPAAEFSPAPLPTHAGGIRSLGPVFVASMAGLSGAPDGMAPLAGVCSIRPMIVAQTMFIYRDTLRRHHVFCSLRPWWISQRYLPPEQRPVDLGRTLVLLGCLALTGMGLMIAGGRRSRDRPLSNPQASLRACGLSKQDLRQVSS